MDDAGRAEDGEAADDAEARVPCFFGDGSAIGYGDGDEDIGRPAMGAAEHFQLRADHLARHWVDGGLARRDGQACAGDRADAFAGGKNNAAAGRATGDFGNDGRAMRHIRIIARILDNSRLGACLAKRFKTNAKAGVSPLGRTMETGSGNLPVSSAVMAALAAAVAHAPVVQPRRSGVSGLARPASGSSMVATL